MTSAELSKIIRLQRQKEIKAGDSAKAKELEDLWNDLYNAKIQNPSDVDTWVKSKGSQLAKFGLDSNEEIDKILVKSDKEIYGKIPELQDKEYLDKLDKFSIAKLRSDARKNGFSSVQDYIQAAYKFKADREFMKSFEQDPNAGKIDKARAWVVKNFYPNAYEAAKNQQVYGTKSDNNKIRNSLIADQILNAAAIGSGPIGGLFKQMALGGGIAAASEGAGKYFSNKDIDPTQIALGAGLGAFGGRIAGKSGGDLIKGAAGRLGIKPQGNTAGKFIYGLGDVLESAAIDPKEEVAMARKASKKWLGPTQKELLEKDIERIKKDPTLWQSQKAAKIKNLRDYIQAVGPTTTRTEIITGSPKLQSKLKDKLADPKKFDKEIKDYWRESLKNQLPTKENIKVHKDIIKYSNPEFNAFKSSDLPLLEVEKPFIELEGKTGVPFRKAWAEPKYSSSLRAMLQSGSQLAARKSREMDVDDTVSIYNAIVKDKPDEVEKYNSGLDNNLTPYEKDIIQKFYIRK